MYLDLLWAWRVLRAGRSASLLAIVGLALALGLSTSVFTLLDALMFRGPAVSAVETVVQIRRVSSVGSSNDWPFEEYREALSLSRRLTVEGWTDAGALLQIRDNSIEVPLGLVSGNFFSTFGVPAAVGRLLTSDDDRVGTVPTAVLSHAFWARHLRSDDSVVGTQINIGSIRAHVVGIAARDFTGLDDPTVVAPPALWIPLTSVAHLDGLREFGTSASSVKVAGRLAPGASLAEAQAELSALSVGWSDRAGFKDRPRAQLSPVDPGWSSTRAAGVILAILGLVILLAALNVSNLLLATMVARRSELAVRSALGASKARISRQLVLQGAVVGAIAGIMGFPFSFWSAPALARIIQSPEYAPVVPGLATVIFAGVAAIAVGLCIGGLLALSWLRTASATGLVRAVPAMRSTRWTQGFIAVQAGISTLFLIVAILFVRAERRVSAVDYGFDIDRVVEVSAKGGNSAGGSETPWQERLRRLQSAPGVEMTGLSRNSPLMAYADRNVHQLTVSADYFAVMGLDVLQGRSFDGAELTQPVAVITERVARTYWPDQSPIGDSLRRVLPRDASVTVVGVVRDSITNRIGWTESGVIYRPLSTPRADDYGLIRFSAPVTPESLRLVASLVGTSASSEEMRVWPLTRYRTLEIGRVQRMKGLVTALGIVSLSLAMLGVVGITSFGVGQRIREIALRLAVGANPMGVLSMLIRDTLKPTIVGIAAGIVLAGVAGGLFRNFLAGISPWDPWAVGAAVTVFLVAAIAAAWLPAKRAVRLDLARTLRE